LVRRRPDRPDVPYPPAPPLLGHAGRHRVLALSAPAAAAGGCRLCAKPLVFCP